MPKAGRVWCGRLPHERLGKVPERGDRIVATLDDGSTYEVAPKY